MTRFARAKGSKSSNERLPNDATPWDVMKQQLEESQVAKQFGKKKAKSAKELLEDKDDPFYYDTTGNVNHEWASFDDVETSGKPEKIKDHKLTKSKKNKAKNNVVIGDKTVSSEKDGKKKKRESREISGTSNVTEDNEEKEIEIIEVINENKKNKVKNNVVIGDKTISSAKNGKKRKRDSKEISGATNEAMDKEENEIEIIEEIIENRETNLDSHLGKKAKKSKSNSKTADTVSQISKKPVNYEINGESNLDLETSKSLRKKAKKSKSNRKTVDNEVIDSNNTISEEPMNSEINLETAEPSAKKARKSKLKSKAVDQAEKIKSNNVNETDLEKPQEWQSKRQKRNQKNKNKTKTGARNNELQREKSDQKDSKSSGFNVEGNDWSSQVKFGKRNKQPKQKSSAETENQNKTLENQETLKRKLGTNDENTSQDSSNVKKGNYDGKSVNNPNEQNNKRKAPKIRDNKVHKRRKPDPGVIKMMMNGVEIEIVKYDGFPVKKEDAERLEELKKNMIIKGIPRSEINAAMKMERRKAEKALARERKQVCFHCRKSGHNLSDCPELGRDEAGCGICFKCGSAEHTHFECKVNRGDEYRFASCFICREPGHIARQCPDNPKGLYPKGGACKICGDVTHLKKDCPDLIKEKEEATITVEKIQDNTLESLDDDVPSKKTDGRTEIPKKKIVRF